MSLRRQLFFAMMGLVACVLAINSFYSIYSARDFFQSQMEVQVQDATTSLGLQITTSGGDLASVETTFNLLNDSGFYHKISYFDVYGKVIVERSRPLASTGVPLWFVNLIDFKPVVGSAEVMSGWQRLGSVELTAHPAYAYISLWQVLQNQLFLFGVAVCICYLLAAFGLRFLLAPLTTVEEQAEAICRREFPVQEQLPSTPELRRMVVAMNRMVKKIQSMFQEQVELSEGLHRKSHLDAVTDLSNRRDFDARFEAHIRSELGGGSGALGLLQLSNMQAFNDSVGREAGDNCLRDLANVLRQQLGHHNGALLSRRGGTDFCIFIPTVDAENAEHLAINLYAAIMALSWFVDDDVVQVHLGVAHSSSVQLGNKLLSQADMALRTAQTENRNGWQVYTEDKGGSRPAGEWRALLLQLIDERAINLHFQAVFPIATNANNDAEQGVRLLMNEVLCRINDDGALINAAEFWPMIERFDLSSRVDRLVLELLQEEVRALSSSGTQSSTLFCVNLSPRSVINSDFCAWLDHFLQSDTELAARLVFEVPEKAISIDESAVRELALLLRARGAALSLDHFGVAAKAFNYLQSLPLSHLKVDRSFIRNIDIDADNQFFVKSLVQIAHSCDVMILAEGVETEAEWKQLQALGLDGGQGYFLARPHQNLQNGVV